MISIPDSHLFQHYTDVMQQDTSIVSNEVSILRGPLPDVATPNLDELYAKVADSNNPSDDFRDMLRKRLTETSLPLLSAVGRTTIMSSVIAETYPPSMQFCAASERIDRLLEMPEADKFSFITMGETDGEGAYTGSCLAYKQPSMLSPGKNEVLYLDDLVITDVGQKQLVGIRAFRELLTRAQNNDITTIELLARHSTSYKGFRGDRMRRILNKMGYSSVDHGVAKTYDSEDGVEDLHLIEVQRTS